MPRMHRLAGGLTTRSTVKRRILGRELPEGLAELGRPRPCSCPRSRGRTWDFEQFGIDLKWSVSARPSPSWITAVVVDLLDLGDRADVAGDDLESTSACSLPCILKTWATRTPLRASSMRRMDVAGLRPCPWCTLKMQRLADVRVARDAEDSGPRAAATWSGSSRGTPSSSPSPLGLERDAGCPHAGLGQSVGEDVDAARGCRRSVAGAGEADWDEVRLAQGAARRARAARSGDDLAGLEVLGHELLVDLDDLVHDRPCASRLTSTEVAVALGRFLKQSTTLPYRPPRAD